MLFHGVFVGLAWQNSPSRLITDSIAPFMLAINVLLLDRRKAFAGFDFERVARYGEADVERLLGDAAIVRHRGKIEATINNARRAVELVEAEGSIAAFVWRFEPEPAAPSSAAETEESRALAKELKRRGWRFVGPTTVYAFMQAMGLVNDHHEGCDAREPALRARAALR